MDIETYALAKAYTDKEVAGGGAIKGKNCVITEIEEITGGHRVHFQWTLDDGTIETDTMDVMDGSDVDASEINGNIRIDGEEVTVYDDTAVTTAIENIEDELSTDSATVEGNPLNFTTKSAQNAESTIIDLEPIQDLHGYDYPWVGGAGKNLLDSSTVIISNWTFTQDDNGYVSETPNNSDGRTWVYSNAQYKLSLASGNYKVVIDTRTVGTNVSRGIEIFDSSNNQISLSPAAVPFSAVGIATYTFALSNSANIGVIIKHYDAVARFMIIKASETDTSYEPYTNICPISGRTQVGVLGCGKNLFDKNNIEVGAYNLNTGNKVADANSKRTINPIIVKPNTTYYFSGTSNNAFRVFWYTEFEYIGTTVLYGDSQFTTSNNITKINIHCGTLDNFINTFQMEENSQSTQYTAYQSSNALTISFGQTVYGGTLDIENGVLVVDRGYKSFDGTESWEFNALGNASIQISDMKQGNNQSGLCSYLEIGNTSGKLQLGAGGSNRIYIIDAVNKYGLSTTAEVQTFTDGMDLIYPLATPITINLTPHTINLLKGVNNISTDGDKITLTYRDGSVATLGDLTSAVDSLDNKIEDSKILTDTETGTKYRLVVTDGVLGIEEVTEPNALSTSPLSLSNSSVETSEESSEESNE